jgi:L-ribulose-5-phosphate 3-epimerase
MMRIGIMEGRLFPPEAGRFQSFPREHWSDEFDLAAKAGLDCIEWIYDMYGADVNPLATDAGIERMKSLSKQYGVQVVSLCADYFMDKPLVRASAAEMTERMATLEWLMSRCQLLGMNRIVIPFVDASRIDTVEEFESVCAVLTSLLLAAGETGIELHLETSLPPKRFAELLARLPHPILKANYDSGNSSALGFKPQDEFAAYGRRVGSVHIKDRLLGGGTVPLGKGDADFPALAEGLKSAGYTGDFMLQVARETPGNEVNWARQNREFVQKNFVEKLMELS